MIFEGEYINGKRNGRGKELDCYGNILFEGKYLNGKRNGKGKEYDYSGNLIFEGVYLNGKIWIGKEYAKNGNFYQEINYQKKYIQRKSRRE